MPFRWNRSAGLIALIPPLSFGAVSGHAVAQTIDSFPIPTPNSRPYTLVPAVDGGIWFTESKGNRIGRITAGGQITEKLIGTGVGDLGIYGICAGPHGEVVFTERFADRIGILHPDGTVDEYDIPTPFCQPWDITLGADGNYWFTEEEANQIGMMTPEGEITEFPTGSCCFPTFICAGPDGNIWFTLEIGDQIVRMETGANGGTPGNTTVFQMDRVQVLPWDINPGPDGALWITELAGRAVARITMHGEITEFPVGGGDFGGVAGICAGPDGRMYFTENDTHRIGVMTTGGEVLNRVPTPGERPLAITSGRDGNIWFTMADGNMIGRLNIAQSDRQYALALDAGFSPGTSVLKLGETMQWTFLGTFAARIADASGMRLFDSGPRRSVDYFNLRVLLAGTFEYGDPGARSHRGSFSAAPLASAQGRVGTPFTVTWALAPIPPGFVVDVVSLAPGSTQPKVWQSGVRTRSADFTADSAGVWKFAARVRSAGSGRHSEFSPPVSVDVRP